MCPCAIALQSVSVLLVRDLRHSRLRPRRGKEMHGLGSRQDLPSSVIGVHKTQDPHSMLTRYLWQSSGAVPINKSGTSRPTAGVFVEVLPKQRGS